MDRLLKIRRTSREMSSSYVPGDCHICHQSNVKVRRMQCGKHNYCRMCVEFVPRFVNGDFTCKTCSVKTKASDTVSRDTVDMFLTTQAGIKSSKTDMTVSVDGKKIIAFEEQSDDNDLEGNNAEWDHLLQPVSANNKHTFSVNRFGTAYPRNDSVCARAGSPVLQPISKKSSYIRLVLPSADNDYCNGENNGSSSKQPITNNVTQLINSQHQATSLSCARGDSRNGSSETGSNSSGSGRGIQYARVSKTKHSLRGNFEQDPNELERGTSPCKGLRPRNCFSWTDERYTPGIEESPSEIERLKEEIGDIEGPQYSSSSSASRSCSGDSLASSTSSRKYVLDDFWD